MSMVFRKMNFARRHLASSNGIRQLCLPKSTHVVANLRLSSQRVRTFASLTSSKLLDRSTIEGPHGKYMEEYQASIQDPERFWAKAAEKIDWYRKPTTILERPPSEGGHEYRWFPDGSMNTCYNCLDVHVQNGRGGQTALIYDSPVTNTKASYTYAEMLEHVSTLAGGLKDDLGVEPGDRVVIYMPQIPEAVIAMLACARIGAVHSVVFGGFAAKELATRISDCQPKVIISASAGVEPNRIVPYKPLLDEALKLADHKVLKSIIVQRRNVETCDMGSNDIDYEDFMARVSKPASAIPLPANHPHYM